MAMKRSRSLSRVRRWRGSSFLRAVRRRSAASAGVRMLLWLLLLLLMLLLDVVVLLVLVSSVVESEDMAAREAWISSGTLDRIDSPRARKSVAVLTFARR